MMKENIEVGLRRRLGMSQENREELSKFNEQQTDWFTTCRKCGTHREGSIADLKKPCGCANG